MESVEIVYDDPGFAVARKPSGMLSEGGGEREADLEQAVSALLGQRVWCCHRLDRLTSGLLVVRKGRRYLKELSQAFESGRVRKEYWLLLDGAWDKRIQKVETNIVQLERGIYANVAKGGKKAVSTFQRLALSEDGSLSLVRGLLKTGRTHQLRLHAQLNGCPVLGDPVYGRPRLDSMFGLHARSLKMSHPGSGESLELEAAPPAAWAPFLKKLGR